jgi:hypothetical protein
MVTSNDGVVWTPHAGLVWTPAVWGPADYRLFELSYGNGRWLVCGAHRGTGKVDWFWSGDEVTWVKVTDPPRGIQSLAFGSGEWLALTVDEFFAPILHASTDGERWTLRTLPNDIGYFAFLTYGDGMWVISASPVQTALIALCGNRRMA